MAAPLITQDDLILALNPGGTEKLRQLAGTDAAGQPNADKVAYGIEVATEEGYELLLGGFQTNERVQALAATDVAVRFRLCMIARYAMAEGNEQFRTPDGKNQFASSAREARDGLREKSRGAKRSSAEGTEVSGAKVGQSSLLRPRASKKGGSMFDKCGGLF